MQYKKVTVKLTPYDETAAELLMAQMGEMGFDSFEETADGFAGYAQMCNYTDVSLNSLNAIVEGIAFETEESVVDDEDWNKEWEENSFEPIVIAGKVRIRSPRHDADPNVEHEIVINPHMSFGTGYHETTTMMIEYLTEMNVEGMNVLDMGCGTGILGIMAIKRGASSADCVDIDEWCYNNTLENIGLNNTSGIKTILGGAEVLPTQPVYDLVIANINRNILTRDMHIYAQTLKSGGQMLLSGFYTEDAQQVTDEAAKHGLTLCQAKERNNWNCLRLQKQ